jgi:ring-1,2-phenylacetyl-CoA epoxidase subunit PaaE
MSAAFHTLKIASITRETPEAISVCFDVPEGDTGTFAFKPGQHLTLRTMIDGEEVRRNYSICTAPSDGEMRIAIKAIQGGVFSNWANASLRVDDAIDVMPPHGIFTIDFDPATSAHYVFFAGGSGITPILSLLKTALNVEPQSRVTLVYGNRDTGSTIFLEELQCLKNSHMNRLSLVNVLSDELDDIDVFNGVLDRAKCDELLATLPDLQAVRAFFICGPGPMMDAAEAALRDRNIAPDRIMVERFTVGRPSASEAAALAAQSEEAQGTRMQVTLDGRTRMVSFDAAAGNILDSVRAGGLPAPYACKAGVCATCRAKLVSGEVRMAARYGLSDDDIAKGYILTCQAIPLGGGIVVNFDQ